MAKREDFTPNGIGTLNEGPLHEALKAYYQQPGDEVEAKVSGFVIDLKRGQQLIEIHTGGFSQLKRKLPILLKDYRVRLVCPVAKERWILKLPSAMNPEVSRRKSPRRAGFEDIFMNLVSIPELIAHPRFEIEVIETAQEEVRMYDGRRRGRRRKGWVVVERRLLNVLDTRLLAQPHDLLSIIPSTLPETFDTMALAKSLNRPRRLAQQATYCLRKLGIAEVVGKDGNALVYSLA